MKKNKNIFHKRFAAYPIAIAAVVIGIGCICWAMYNIGLASYYADGNKTLFSVGSSYSASAPPITNDMGNSTKATPTQVISTPTTVIYPDSPKAGDRIGSLIIPALDKVLPIVEGTDTDSLKKGVGHYIKSVLPGEMDNCVLSGHRDTVFTELGKLKLGEILIVKTSAGVFTYKIKLIRIVDKEDRTVIVPTENAVLTLSTCYPFNYIGFAPDRYIIVADLVSTELSN